MANSITAFNEEIWSRQMQEVFFKENVAIALANTELRDQLSSGDTVNKPYRSHLVVKNYTKGTDITVQDVSGSNEQLTVSTAKVVPSMAPTAYNEGNPKNLILSTARLQVKI